MAPEMQAPGKFRVAVLNTHPIQYFAPLYRRIAESCPEVELTVLYLSDFSLRGATDPGFRQSVVWDIDLLEGYEYRFVGRNYRECTPAGFWSLATPAIWKEIRDGKFDLVWLHGYAHAALLTAIAAAKSCGTDLALRGDSQLLLNPPGLRRCVRNGIINRLFRLFDWFLAVGTRNADYYRYMGASSRQILRLPYSIDNRRFSGAETRPPAGPVIVLFAAKLIPRKDPFTFIEAARLLADRGVPVVMRMAGSGELEEQLRKKARDLKLSNLEFCGFVNQAAMPDLMRQSDIFVATSDWEPWGLVINEAMAAGMAIITSDETGCSVDLVHDGVNGYRIGHGNAKALAACIEDLVTQRDRLEAFQRESRRIVDAFSLDRSVECFSLAIREIRDARASRQTQVGAH